MSPNNETPQPKKKHILLVQANQNLVVSLGGLPKVAEIGVEREAPLELTLAELVAMSVKVF